MDDDIDELKTVDLKIKHINSERNSLFQLRQKAQNYASFYSTITPIPSPE